MKSTLNYLKVRLRKTSQQQQSQPSSAPVAGEWEEDAPPAPASSFPCKNRRAADDSLLACIGSDVSSLAEKTRLARARPWRRRDSHWLCGHQPETPSAVRTAAGEDRGLLPVPPHAASAEPADQPLLLRHRLRRAASDEDWTLAAASTSAELGHRRNSLSELDENVGSDLPPTWAAAVNDASDAGDGCPTADLLGINSDR